MKVVADTAERTVLVYRPPRGVLIGAVVVTLVAWAGWLEKQRPVVLPGSTGAWFTAGLVCSALTALVACAVFLNRRTLVFDWPRRTVDDCVHNWNPLFRDETARHALKNLACWTIAQEPGGARARTSPFWRIGFERADGPVLAELFFERSFGAACARVRLLAAHAPAPIVVTTVYDGAVAGGATEAFRAIEPAAAGERPAAHSPVRLTAGRAGELELSLPTDRRLIPARGSPMRRWPLMLIEGAAALALAVALPFAQQRPHPLRALVAVYALVVLPIFAAGCVGLWLGLRDLTGRTHLVLRDGRLRLTQTVLGLGCGRAADVPRERLECALVARVGYNPYLLLWLDGREYRLGAGLEPEPLLLARAALTAPPRGSSPG